MNFSIKFIRVILVILLIICSTTASASAVEMCLNTDGHRLCIVRIKRSAKNYWEYRTKVEIDGKKRVKEIYNCRDRTVTRRGKAAIPFKPDSLGKMVCELFD